MPQYPPIVYSLPDGAAGGTTVDASNPEEAFRKAACSLLRIGAAEVEAMIAQGELEVIAVIEGDPHCVPVQGFHLFPGL